MSNYNKPSKLQRFLLPKILISRNEGLGLILEISITLLLIFKLFSLVYQNNKFREDTVEALVDQTILINRLKNNLLHSESLSPEDFESSLKKLNDTLKGYAGIYVPTCAYEDSGRITIRSVGGNSYSIKDLSDYKISQSMRKTTGESCRFDRQVIKEGRLNQLSFDEDIQNLIELAIVVLGLCILYLKIIYFFYRKLYLKDLKVLYKASTPQEYKYL